MGPEIKIPTNFGFDPNNILDQSGGWVKSRNVTHSFWDSSPKLCKDVLGEYREHLKKMAGEDPTDSKDFGA